MPTEQTDGEYRKRTPTVALFNENGTFDSFGYQVGLESN